jgi:chromosome segregation ATPase
MAVLSEDRMIDSGVRSPPRAKTRLLMQMAEVLEDQASGLYRRAATSEEEESLLNREIEERQTEINRLVLKWEAIRAERDRLLEKIASISEEATAIREEIFCDEEEDAIAAIEAFVPGVPSAAESFDGQTARENMDPESDSSFFRRMTLSEQPLIHITEKQSRLR